ncbi:MAG: PAS domain S-box protein [Desulfobacteraceae bacterium]|nr:MAG: PAS domain S-box protein [Desulfobacteraceae bacterium]
MFAASTIIFVICIYIGMLVFVATWVEKQALKGKNWGNNAIVYSLSLAIYCTSWTYYGSVGSAASSGMLFLTMYIGPTIGIFFWWTLLRRLVRIKQTHRINSIADFISARYNHSRLLAAIASVIAFVGIAPYIALQIKSILSTFILIAHQKVEATWIFTFVDPIFIGLMIAFTIIFGVRRLDPTERHQGMMTAVALESVVKLSTFLLAGIFVTYFLFNGMDDIFQRFSETPFSSRQTIGPDDASAPFMLWMTYLILAMSAVLFLPRQFHVAVVENSNEKHILTAMWMFPLYMFLINIFVLPIAMAGLIKGFSLQEADTFVLRLPLEYGKPWMTLLVFLGGFSAAMSMIMVSSMTMATMVTNHLLLPLFEYLPGLGFMRRRILEARWCAVALIILSGYWFEKNLGGSYTLVNMGILSFAAAIQFAPPIIGGLFWRRGNHYGTVLGLSAGFILWLYTLLLPSLIKSGWLLSDMLLYGPWGAGLLKPENLLGMNGLDPLSHGVFWCLLVNTGLYVSGSLIFEKNTNQAVNEFIDELIPDAAIKPPVWTTPSITVSMSEKLPPLIRLLSQYMPHANAWALISKSLGDQGMNEKSMITILEMADFCGRVKKRLSGSIGTAEAHKAFAKAGFFTPEEQVELTSAYGEILASLDLTPEELYRKIDFYQERNKLISDHAKALEEKVEALQIEIAERVRVEQALKNSEDKYRILVENATDAIAIIQDSNIVFSNPETLKLLGYTASELQDMLFTELMHPDDRETGASRYQRRLAGETIPGLIEYRFIAKNGNTITVLVSAVKIDWEGRPALLFIARDITEQKKLEAQLLQSQKMEALGTLAGGVAHDFNNLLMGIQGNISIMLLKMDPQNPDFQRLKNMEEYIGDAARLTSQLMGLARKGKYEVRTIDINQLISKITDMFGRTKKELKIVNDLSVVPPVEVDRSQIELALLNLFVNAWQAMPGGGTMTISTDIANITGAEVDLYGLKPGAYVKISVSDTGVGMDQEIQKKAFDPFFTTKAMGRGTGLGLSSAYGIIKNHSGFISISSQPGSGATFNVFLPVSAKTVFVESKQKQGMRYGRETILLIDDESMILEVGTEILKMLGYTVLTANSGKTAEAIFKENKNEISLVILDMIMPEMSGSILYDQLKKTDPDVRVLLSSGYSMNEQATEIIKKGCNGFIQKPFDIAALSHKIRNIIDKKTSKRHDTGSL